MNVSNDERTIQDQSQNLTTHSKLMFLYRTMEQHNLAIVHLLQNEEQRRRIYTFREYNRLRLLELNLARERILLANGKTDSGIIPDLYDNKQQGLPFNSRRERIQNSILSNGPTILTGTMNGTAIAYSERRMASSSHSECVQPNDPHDSSFTDERQMGSPHSVTVGFHNQGLHDNSAENQQLLLKQQARSHFSLPIPWIIPEKTYGHDSERHVIPSTARSDDFIPKDTQKNNLIESQLSVNESIDDDSCNDDNISQEDSSTDSISTEVQRKDKTRRSLKAMKLKCRSGDLFENEILPKKCRISHSSSSFNDADVLFERGNFACNHPGNKVYRDFVKELQDEYMQLRKNDKHIVTTRVLDFVKKARGGRFLVCDKEGQGQWEELSDKAAKRKIGQCFRDM